METLDIHNRIREELPKIVDSWFGPQQGITEENNYIVEKVYSFKDSRNGIEFTVKRKNYYNDLPPETEYEECICEEDSSLYVEQRIYFKIKRLSGGESKA